MAGSPITWQNINAPKSPSRSSLENALYGGGTTKSSASGNPLTALFQGLGDISKFRNTEMERTGKNIVNRIQNEFRADIANADTQAEADALANRNLRAEMLAQLGEKGRKDAVQYADKLNELNTLAEKRSDVVSTQIDNRFDRQNADSLADIRQQISQAVSRGDLETFDALLKKTGNLGGSLARSAQDEFGKLEGEAINQAARNILTAAENSAAKSHMNNLLNLNTQLNEYEADPFYGDATVTNDGQVLFNSTNEEAAAKYYETLTPFEQKGITTETLLGHLVKALEVSDLYESTTDQKLRAEYREQLQTFLNERKELAKIKSWEDLSDSEKSRFFDIVSEKRQAISDDIEKQYINNRDAAAQLRESLFAPLKGRTSPEEFEALKSRSTSASNLLPSRVQKDYDARVEKSKNRLAALQQQTTEAVNAINSDLQLGEGSTDITQDIKKFNDWYAEQDIKFDKDNPNVHAILRDGYKDTSMPENMYISPEAMRMLLNSVGRNKEGEISSEKFYEAIRAHVKQSQGLTSKQAQSKMNDRQALLNNYAKEELKTNAQQQSFLEDLLFTYNGQ